MATIEQSRTLLSKKLPELRTVSALVDQVQRTAVSAINSGQSVVIDRMLPSVAIYHGPDQEFFFQEHEAKKLLDDAEVAVEGLVQETHQVLVVEDYLLFLSQSW
jgi:thymidylate kinase